MKNKEIPHAFTGANAVMFWHLVWNVRIFLIIMGMLARLFEEICQIHFVSICVVFSESDRLDQCFIFIICVEKGAVNTAKIDEIECGASHDEHRLEFIRTRSMSKINDLSTVCVHFELTYTAQFAVYQRAVGKQLGTKGNVAQATDFRLFFLGLNR